MSNPHTQPTRPANAEGQVRSEQSADGNTSDPPPNQTNLQLPSPGTSQTYRHPIQTKQEGSPSATVRQHSIEVDQGSSNEWQKARQKRKRNLEDDLEDIKLQQEALRLKRQLRALKDRDGIARRT